MRFTVSLILALCPVVAGSQGLNMASVVGTPVAGLGVAATQVELLPDPARVAAAPSAPLQLRQYKVYRENTVATPAPAAQLPQILDVTTQQQYRRAFAQARQGATPTLQGLDQLLVGYVEAARLQRLGSRARLGELNDWLSRYGTLPPAKEIYDQAVRLRKRGQTVVVPTLVRLQEEAKQAREEADDMARDTVAQANQRARVTLQRELQQLRQSGRLAAAQAKLLTPDNLALLGPEATATAAMMLARNLVLERDWLALVRLAQGVPNLAGTAATELYWWGGLAAYQLGQHQAALALWQTVVGMAPKTDPYYARAAVWAARSAEALDRFDLARRLRQQATQDPFSFYGLLAQQLLGRTPQVNWQTPSISAVSADYMQQQPAIRQALALAEVGEVDYGQKVLRYVFEQIPPQHLPSLVAVALAKDLPGSALHLSRQLARQGQPIPAGLFPDKDRWRPADGERIDPALLFAIMRQESAFMPNVSSRVGARGLMQVMPGTAEHVRKELGLPQLSREQQFDIGINLTLGQEYLVWMLGEFNGNLMQAVAAYNAGPGNVRRWVANLPTHDPLLWLELVPFRETRFYIDKVMANLWLYRQKFTNTPTTLADLAKGRWPRYDNPHAADYAALLAAKRLERELAALERTSDAIEPAAE